MTLTVSAEKLEKESGKCGENATFTFDYDTGELVISGTGAVETAYWFFGDYENILTVTIEDGITSIGDDVFRECENLREVTIADSVTWIGYETFLKCAALERVDLGEGVTYIDSYAFSGCTKLADLTLPQSLRGLGSYVFNSCPIERVDLYENFTNLGFHPFLGCSKLTGIWVAEENTKYSSDEYGVLFNEEKTELIAAPSAMTGHYVIPDTVETIAFSAFDGCRITGVTIPDSVTDIEREAFSYSRLTSVTVPGSITILREGVFAGCSHLTEVNLPEGLTELRERVFIDCSSLTGITLPESLKEIGANCFRRCTSLKNLLIPANVTLLDECSLAECSNLQYVVFAGDFPEIGYDAFFHYGSYDDMNTTYCFYPENNETWASFLPQNYEGRLIWLPDRGETGLIVPFVDVPEDSFYFLPVVWATDNGITSGMDETHFGPTSICNRAQIVTFLWRAMGCPAPTTTENPFVDVTSDAFYYDAVLWAYENGITTGTDATHFSPNQNCNRAQVVTFLWRSQGSPQIGYVPFVDVPYDAFYYPAVAWAYSQKITSGVDYSHFGPNELCMRAQVVTFLFRTMVR